MKRRNFRFSCFPSSAEAIGEMENKVPFGRSSDIFLGHSIYRFITLLVELHKNLTVCKVILLVILAVYKIPTGEMLYTVSQKNCAKLFLSELLQISTNFDNFWQKDSKEAKLMRGALIFHLALFVSPHYRVKCRCSKLLHNAASC